MRNQLPGIRYVALAGAALLLSFTVVPAQAQHVPRGSYLDSCTGVRMFGNRLVADCRRADGGWRRTALDVNRCAGGIANTNGHLTCNFSIDRGFGSSFDRRWDYRRDWSFGR